jgi:hypothetical protein
MDGLQSRRTSFFFALLILGMLTTALRPSAVQASTLFGTVGLTGEDGRFVPGEMLRIYLVTEPIQVEFSDDRTLNRYDRIVRANNAHIDFFIKYREHASRTGYLQSVAESSIAGTFTFRDLPPGRYWVLVTFPSMIAGQKVAWQLPVDIGADDHVWVHLTADNLLLPALSR